MVTLISMSLRSQASAIATNQALLHCFYRINVLMGYGYQFLVYGHFNVKRVLAISRAHNLYQYIKSLEACNSHMF